MELIPRQEYVDRLLAFRDKRVIKVVTGVRRCGKSTLLSMVREHLKAAGVEAERIVSVNFEDFDNFPLREPQALHRYVCERLRSGVRTYIFFDEIQYVERFPDVLNSLFLREETDIYVTGSNAWMLSSELATLIAGRYVELSLLPLSFREYLSAVGQAEGLARAYTNYASRSALPYAVQFGGDTTQLSDYLSGIYHTIVLKDVVARGKVSDPTLLESLVRFTLDNIGNLLSPKRIADFLTSAGRKTDVRTVEKYLSALTDSFILYKAPRYNIRGMQLLRTQEKYYVVDLGLRTLLLGSRGYDVGRVLENVVYLELRRRAARVFVGSLEGMEVDFVTFGSEGQTYYQVAATVRSEDTLRRELAPLRALKDQYPKWLLTLDDDPPADYGGIRRVNVLDWLLRPSSHGYFAQ